jgi:hypothetical protein
MFILKCVYSICTVRTLWIRVYTGYPWSTVYHVLQFSTAVLVRGVQSLKGMRGATYMYWSNMYMLLLYVHTVYAYNACVNIHIHMDKCA